jgi:hypothetical protein
MRKIERLFLVQIKSLRSKPFHHYICVGKRGGLEPPTNSSIEVTLISLRLCREKVIRVIFSIALPTELPLP